MRSTITARPRWDRTSLGLWATGTRLQAMSRHSPSLMIARPFRSTYSSLLYQNGSFGMLAATLVRKMSDPSDGPRELLPVTTIRALGVIPDCAPHSNVHWTVCAHLDDFSFFPAQVCKICEAIAALNPTEPEPDHLTQKASPEHWR